MEFKPDLERFKNVQTPSGTPPTGMPRKSNIPLLSMILGIAGLLLVGSLIGLIPAILAIIFGVAGLRGAKKVPRATAPKGLAISGLITGSAAIAMFAFVLVTYIYVHSSLIVPNLATMEKLTKALQFYADENDNYLPEDLKDALEYVQFPEDVNPDEIIQDYGYFYFPYKVEELDLPELPEHFKGFIVLYTKQRAEILWWKYIMVMNLLEEGGVMTEGMLEAKLDEQGKFVEGLRKRKEEADEEPLEGSEDIGLQEE